ncbi:MAG: histidinol-phosphate transaminase [Hyphomicrobiaceae bacterium]|nr:histidinol-phosphate transaminase [Hyphomicrobiaceae bacterium]
MLKPKPGILDIDAYVPGDSHAGGGGRQIKLSSNEAPLGPSPAAVEAYRAAAGSLARYPDGSARALREAIGEAFGLDPSRIVCGAGSDELLSLIAHAYIGHGDEGLYSKHGFLVYPIAIKANGGRPVAAGESDGLVADVDRLLAAVTARTRVVFLANPNNPTGTYLPQSEVRRLRAGLPDDVLLVLDGAYAEFVEAADYDDGRELVTAAPSTVMTRTFSKVHGLASLRIGWAYAPDAVADVINRIRGPFNLSAAAIAAGAAAIRDRAHLEAAVAHNTRWRGWLAAEVSRLGLAVTPSVANFILVHFPPGGGAARQADAALRARGIIVRRVDAYGLPDALRITVGTEEENRILAAALAEIVRGMASTGGLGGASTTAAAE